MTGARALRAPEPLTATHDMSRFINGIHTSLDQWLGERARLSERLSARTYVAGPVDDPRSGRWLFLDLNGHRGAECAPFGKAPPRHARASAAAPDRTSCGRCGLARPGTGVSSPDRRVEAMPCCVGHCGSEGRGCPCHRRSGHRLLRTTWLCPFAIGRARHVDSNRNCSIAYHHSLDRCLLPPLLRLSGGLRPRGLRLGLRPRLVLRRSAAEQQA